MKKISNPLTIIGLFAGIAEIAGTVVLSLVSEDLQGIFIWYVMFFPVLLVVAFFYILKTSPSALYAPSDFTDENHYMKLNMEEFGNKLEDVAEQHPETAAELESIQTTIFERMTKDDIGMRRRYKKVLDIISGKEKGVTALELSKEMNIVTQYARKILVRMTIDGLLKRVNNEERDGEAARARYRYTLKNNEVEI